MYEWGEGESGEIYESAGWGKNKKWTHNFPKLLQAFFEMKTKPNQTKPTQTYQGHLYNLKGTLLVKCHYKEGNIKQI